MQFCMFLQHCKGQLTSVKINHVTFKMWFKIKTKKKLNLDYFRQL